MYAKRLNTDLLGRFTFARAGKEEVLARLITLRRATPQKHDGNSFKQQNDIEG